jgi:ISXO2-like transposase domain
MTEFKNGISARELQQKLGLLCYRSAWTIGHKLRSAMRPSLQNRLRGSVVVDKTYVSGNLQGVSGRQANRKFIVAVATEIVDPWTPRHVRLRRIQDDSSDSLLHFVCEVTRPGCNVHTDKLGNDELRAHGYCHGGVKEESAHTSTRYGPGVEAFLSCIYQGGHTLVGPQMDVYLRARGPSPPLIGNLNTPYSIHALMPRAVRVYSELEAWLSCTHQGAGAITGTHLDAYIDEFAFRVNFRRNNRPGLLFHRLLKAALSTLPTRYRRSRRG